MWRTAAPLYALLSATPFENCVQATSAGKKKRSVKNRIFNWKRVPNLSFNNPVS